MNWKISGIISLVFVAAIAAAFGLALIGKENCELGMTDVRLLEPAESELLKQEFRLVCVDPKRIDPEIEYAIEDSVEH